MKTRKLKTYTLNDYHSGEGMLSVRRMLPTLPIVGILEETPSNMDTGHKFYITLRQRVERALEEEGHTRHSFELLHLVEFMITAFILSHV